jgi:hypothetical protein
MTASGALHQEATKVREVKGKVTRFELFLPFLFILNV